MRHYPPVIHEPFVTWSDFDAIGQRVEGLDVDAARQSGIWSRVLPQEHFVIIDFAIVINVDFTKNRQIMVAQVTTTVACVSGKNAVQIWCKGLR